MAQTISLHMNNISIEFPGIKALNNINLITHTGRTHAIIGANGAGKSTLMKILAGAYHHYTGEICINEQQVDIRTPKAAKDLGIQIVYQEVDTALVPYLTVAENIMLEQIIHGTNPLLVNWQTMHHQAELILKRLNINISTKRLISELTLAQKQMVLIARALARKCSFLVLDEPTAPLSQYETAELFRIIRELRQTNVGILFISHRLPELFEICDIVTVLRDGEIVATEKIANTSQNALVEYMLGRKFTNYFPKTQLSAGSKVLEVQNLSVSRKLDKANLYVRSGEIIGIAGLVGAGKTELCRTLFGAENISSGEIILHGEQLTLKSPHDAIEAGLALVPEERRKEGILVEESIAVNLTIPILNKFCKLGHFLNSSAINHAANRLIKQLGIKTPDGHQHTRLLSGGNQQKVVIGKWLLTDSFVYIFDEPTKGVDVGAKKDIFSLIGRLAAAGKSVIYASCELSELIGITDRIYVMYGGRIVKELLTTKTTDEELLFYAVGGEK